MDYEIKHFVAQVCQKKKAPHNESSSNTEYINIRTPWDHQYGFSTSMQVKWGLSVPLCNDRSFHKVHTGLIHNEQERENCSREIFLQWVYHQIMIMGRSLMIISSNMHNFVTSEESELYRTTLRPMAKQRMNHTIINMLKTSVRNKCNLKDHIQELVHDNKCMTHSPSDYSP